MQKPNNYDNTTPYSNQEALELGGHILRILRWRKPHQKRGIL